MHDKRDVRILRVPELLAVTYEMMSKLSQPSSASGLALAVLVIQERTQDCLLHLRDESGFPCTKKKAQKIYEKKIK